MASPLGLCKAEAKLRQLTMEVLNLAVSETTSVLVKSLVRNLSLGILLELSFCLCLYLSSLLFAVKPHNPEE